MILWYHQVWPTFLFITSCSSSLAIFLIHCPLFSFIIGLVALKFHTPRFIFFINSGFYQLVLQFPKYCLFTRVLVSVCDITMYVAP